MEEGFCICQVSYLEAQKMQQHGPGTTLGTELISMEIVINEGFKLIILHRLWCLTAAFQIPRTVKAQSSAGMTAHHWGVCVWSHSITLVTLMHQMECSGPDLEQQPSIPL